MHRSLLALLACICLLTPAAAAEEAAPVIDLSVPNDGVGGEEEYQSVRPGALDEKFAPAPRTGGTQIYLGYEDQEGTEDEYGLVRDKPVSSDVFTPPGEPSD